MTQTATTQTTNAKKEQERSHLHATIWKIANDLRGSVDGWDFKQFVLGTLFYRFICENFTNYIEGGDEGINFSQQRLATSLSTNPSFALRSTLTSQT